MGQSSSALLQSIAISSTKLVYVARYVPETKWKMLEAFEKACATGGKVSNKPSVLSKL